MLRTYLQASQKLRVPLTRAYAIKDSHSHQKPSSQGHATSKDDKDHNIQSKAVKEGMEERKNAGPPKGEKKETHSKAPGPVIGMQDERGGKNE
ncbi:hypothetical protein BCR37DRAFT_395943 [Protomyces lactucae-debilis]|uniref:Uncharacterized protein n=1 Tax=Protomyces lactucae-debilis TaxID=2754530 RepID=A0A1Y2EQW9_PROLT|nr:uncharacterized protein BCR37DRAFT_395943 [Protomyces lactucae-debilis]ORY73684.1 hypothetical protein BCR37DRAFT_395943 [Protomyces lactucae-debilis]